MKLEKLVYHWPLACDLQSLLTFFQHPASVTLTVCLISIYRLSETILTVILFRLKDML